MDVSKLKVGHGRKVNLAKIDAGNTHGISKEYAKKALGRHVEKLALLHDLLYASRQHALLIVLQGMDAAGKDGTIKHVMSSVNPQGCSVTSFKEPTREELEHDFLWRVHKAVPARGTIGIFNRSHYEDVLIARVHSLAPKADLAARYEQINAFEKMLSQNGVTILKFFLHISSEEQQRRFEERIEDPQKNWKASAADFRERQHWDHYQKAYEDALRKCSTPWAPWYVIPADHRWFRNYAVAHTVIGTLEKFRMKYPTPDMQALLFEAAATETARR